MPRYNIQISFEIDYCVETLSIAPFRIFSGLGIHCRNDPSRAFGLLKAGSQEKREMESLQSNALPLSYECKVSTQRDSNT